MNFLVTIQPCLEFMFEAGRQQTTESAQSVLRRLYAFAAPKLTHHHVFGGVPYTMTMDNADRLRRTLEDLYTLTSNHPEFIRWSTTTFYGELNRLGVPSTSLTVSIGWLKAENDMFGVSVRLVCPDDSVHENLLKLGEQCLSEIDSSLVWAILANRFVPSLQFNARFVDSYRDIYYLSRRFPIVDVGDELNLNASFWRDNLRTIGWWNYLGPKFVSRLDINNFHTIDGSNDFTTRLLDSGGMVLNLDDTPVLGDVNQQQGVPKGLSSIYERIEQFIPSSDIDFLNPWNPEETLDWLHRWKSLYYDS